MLKKPVIIWTPDGCWYQQVVDGVERSSYLGNIGPAEQVKEFCENSALDFANKFHPFEGTAIREKFPAMK